MTRYNHQSGQLAADILAPGASAVHVRLRSAQDSAAEEYQQQQQASEYDALRALEAGKAHTGFLLWLAAAILVAGFAVGSGALPVLLIAACCAAIAFSNAHYHWRLRQPEAGLARFLARPAEWWPMLPEPQQEQAPPALAAPAASVAPQLTTGKHAPRIAAPTK